MINMIISFLVVTLSFNFFMMSYQVNGLNRLVMILIFLYHIIRKIMKWDFIITILVIIQFALMKTQKRWRSLFLLHLSLCINTKKRCFMKSGVTKWTLIS